MADHFKPSKEDLDYITDVNRRIAMALGVMPMNPFGKPSAAWLAEQQAGKTGQTYAKLLREYGKELMAKAPTSADVGSVPSTAHPIQSIIKALSSWGSEVPFGR